MMDYKATLNLPKTAFPMKADLPKREPEILARWEREGLYEAMQQARKDQPTFVLHDGPPYANGDIHIGHALNKILKDIIVRYKTMRGFRAPYVPGWDCHGMPIEHQLFKELKLTKHQIDQATFRAKARAYADKYVGIQREQFKRLGVLGDWSRPYLTMAPDYELTILRVFKELVKAGYVYHGKKPVYWCPSCETALAEAEVEYEDRADVSIYIKFPVIQPPKNVPESLLGPLKHIDRLAVAAWTTTPWTLPANVALAIHPNAKYVVLHQKGWPHNLIVAESLASKLAQVLGVTEPINTGWCFGRDLVGMRCQTPFGERQSQVVSDEGVSMEDGTGVVHIAPGHGQEDYLIGQQAGLETLSPVDAQGKFTKEAGQWAGQSVWDANPKIIADLKARGLLLREEPLTHSYPHCWRCKNPVIFRATAQWFLGVDRQDLRHKLLEAATKVQWIPETGHSRMRGMLETRPDWCLSRQRYWGTPIPIVHCEACQQPIMDVATIEQIERVLAEKGTDFWFTAKPQELLPGGCPTCHGKQLRKETDILDVWFDSGVSHEAVLKARQELSWPASLYLEGSDQHRGWFQVSLIPSVALHGRAPYQSVLTHGFVMDGEGRKMSKSLGNVIAPQDIVQRYGADILRLWVASSDYREDVRISSDILERTAEAYRKIRNTFRYLLANLSDFSPSRDAQPVDTLQEFDRWMLQRTTRLIQDVTEAYDAFQFHQVVRLLHQFCVLDLSAFYLDALKDRLYTESAASPKRRSAQTALYAILDSLVRLSAPLLSLTADEVWQSMWTAHLAEGPSSVHTAAWPTAPAPVDEVLERRWMRFLAIREGVMKALEEQRAANVIGSPLEAQVTLVVRDASTARELDQARQMLAEAFVVSELRVVTANATTAPMDVRVERATGDKCQRCWKYLTSVGTSADHPHLCARCADVVTAHRRERASEEVR